MAKKPTEGGRKLVEFDAQTWHALNLLSRESMMSFQELADEAFRDLLHKYGRPTDFRRCARARRVQFQGGGDSRGESFPWLALTIGRGSRLKRRPASHVLTAVRRSQPLRNAKSKGWRL
jgi:hypothetical protein